MKSRTKGWIVLSIFLGVSPVWCQTLTESDQRFISKIETDLVKVVELRGELEDIHPFLSQLHPVALLETDQLFVFDNDSLSGKYEFRIKAPVPFSMSKGVRAALPLSFYGGKTTCIVSAEIFDDLDGYVTIFHEFMHCQQAASCEYKLKGTLEINRKAMEEKNYAWELNHDFPYQDSVFVENYSGFLDALARDDRDRIAEWRTALKKHLSRIDFEYMVWQEWKEGFARLIENRIQAKLNLPVNHYGLEKPYNRIVFYCGGAGFIDYLVRENNELFVDIEALFRRLQAYPELD